MKTEIFVEGNNGNNANAALGLGDFCPTADHEVLCEWVRFGASQVRNNVDCAEKHRRSLRALGESEQRLSELPRWRQSPVFTDKEKAALSLTETVSLPMPGKSSTQALADVQRYFSTEEILRLTMTAMAVNDWIDLQEKPPIRILVVEDDPCDQELFLHQLRKTQMEDNVLFVSNGTHALELIELLRSSNWGLISIFLDIRLPGMSGIELLQRIRNMPGLEDFPVIVMTSSNDPRDLEECKRLKVTSYIEKPITFNAFAKSIANIFHQTKVVSA